MGIDTSYKIWVPRESLLDALRKLSRFSASPEFDRLIWPDGGRISEPEPEENDVDEVELSEDETQQSEVDLIPVDSTYKGSFPVTFDFEPDDGLREYEREMQKLEQEQGVKSEPMLRDGRYFIKGIQLNISLQPSNSRWFGESPLFACLEFEAGHRWIGTLFYASSSMRRFFDDLAVELGAALCTLDSGHQPDYIMVDRYKYEMHPGWFSDFDIAEDFDAAVKFSPYLTRYESKLQQMARYCASSEREFARLLLYTREGEPNLRARAYYALESDDETLVATVLKAGLDDEDWRVRAVVVDTIWSFDLPIVETALLKALQDPHPEVRSIACDKLPNFDTEVVFEALLRIVEETPLTPLNFGLFKNALKGLRFGKVGWNAADVIQKRLVEPEFPFPELAKEVVEKFQSRDVEVESSNAINE